MRAVGVLALVLLGGPGGTSVAAQGLERVEELISVGEGERARQLLAGWLESSPPRAQLPRGIWLEGRLASDPDVAALHYGRVAIEFPGSDFADDALLRLAMLADARGDWGEARARLGSLLRDYPDSPLRLEAGARLRRTPASQTPSSVVAGGRSADADAPVPPWEARAAIEEALRQDLALRESQEEVWEEEEEGAGEPRIGVGSDDLLMEEAEGEPDSSASAGAEPDTTGAEPDTTGAEPDTTGAEPDTTGAQPDSADAEPAAPDLRASEGSAVAVEAGGNESLSGSGDTARVAGGLPPASGRYTVQLGAFSTRERAEALSQQVQRAGLVPRVVRLPGSALFRVRVGHFPSAAVGDEERRRISALGFDAVVSTDGNEETREP